MKIFKFDPSTGRRGEFIESTQLASWTDSYLKPADLKSGSVPTATGFGSNADVGIHYNAGRGLIGEEISYRQPSQWICFCLGAYLIDNAEQWQWVILPPADDINARAGQ